MPEVPRHLRHFLFLEPPYLYRWPCHHRDTAASAPIVSLSVRLYSEFGTAGKVRLQNLGAKFDSERWRERDG